MGSTSNPNGPNPWPPYNAYRDCSLGICSVFCPQWCYIVVPPPPPSKDGPSFSPVVIAVVGILSSAFLLVTYYTLVNRYCSSRRTGHRQGDDPHQAASDDTRIGTANAVSGLDDWIIKSITVYKYRKGDGLVDGTDCSVCLSEFEENESLRLLPKCNHAFHMPCIDTWLKSHSSCPLCRSNIPPSGPGGTLPHPQTSSRLTATITVNLHAYCHLTDAPALVIRDDRRLLVRDEAVISLFWDGGGVSTSELPSLSNVLGDDGSDHVGQEAAPRFLRRSVSLGSTVSELRRPAESTLNRHRIEDGDVQLSIGTIRSSGPDENESKDNIFSSNSSSEMKKSMSTGTFGPGRTPVLPS